MQVKIVIAGAGPAGLLSALLLSKYSGTNVTILEKAPEADPWSSKSFSVNLNPRGLNALDMAGPDVLHAVRDAGMERKRVVLESASGLQNVIPKKPSNWAISRPDLVRVLETLVQQKYPQVKIQRGVEVAGVREAEVAVNDTRGDDKLPLQVLLQHGTTVECTHLIAADGKWSPIRESVSDFQNKFQVRTEPSFGVHFMVFTNNTRWNSDATSIFQSTDPNAKYYVIASPLPDGVFSVSIVCFDEISKDKPWLVPADDTNGNLMNDWEADFQDRAVMNQNPQHHEQSSSSDELRDKVAAMLEEEMPLFYKDIGGSPESLLSFRVRRRTSWLQPATRNPDELSYAGCNFRVVLVGDAGHAMTPSLGEGCNCALESVVRVLESIDSMLQNETDALTDDVLTKAFQTYGKQRPVEVLPIQERSGMSSRYVSSQIAPRQQPLSASMAR